MENYRILCFDQHGELVGYFQIPMTEEMANEWATNHKADIVMVEENL